MSKCIQICNEIHLQFDASEIFTIAVFPKYIYSMKYMIFNIHLLLSDFRIHFLKNFCEILQDYEDY